MIDENVERWLETDVMARARAQSIMEAVIDDALRENLGFACGAVDHRELQPVDIVVLIMAALRKAGLDVAAAR